MSVSHVAPAATLPPDRTTQKFAGHLHSALAACENLRLGLPTDGSPASVGAVLRLELAAISHLLQARACASEILQRDMRLAECAELFLAGTQALEFSTIMQANDYMLGRRLPVSTAKRFAVLMLEAVYSVYPPLPHPVQPPAAAQPAHAA